MFMWKIIDIIAVITITQRVSCASKYPELQEVTVDYGKNVTLPCSDGSSKPVTDWDTVMWILEGQQIDQVHSDGALLLTKLDRKDAGIYSCAINDSDTIISRVKLNVNTPPPALANVTVHPSTVLALLLWEVTDDGGYPILHFTVQYRERNPDANDVAANEWHSSVPEHIGSNVREIDIYRLHPNTTYLFQIWATNQLGPGEVTVLESTTKHSIEEIELARHLLEGAEKFDTRVWVAAVAIVMGTLLMLAIGTCFLLYRECDLPSMHREEQEVIELVPNIILNPGYYDDDARTERVARDENSNDRMTTRINNNTVIQPIRV